MLIHLMPLDKILESYKQGDVDAGLYIISKFVEIIKDHSRQHGTKGPINEDYLQENIESILRDLKSLTLSDPQ